MAWRKTKRPFLINFFNNLNITKMTKAEVVNEVREYTKGQLKTQNFDLDGLNVSHLNDLIKTTLDEIIEECKEGVFNKSGYRQE
jgi:hypothetical protein